MRVYLAGFEGGSNYVTERIPSDALILTSFFYCNKPFIERLIREVGVDNILLDSGAFTFRFKGTKNVSIDEYIDNYIQFINKYDIRYFFEMDIDMSYEDLATVKKYRERIEKGTGKKCIPVWHKTRGINEWKDLVKNYDYIAIGGITSLLDKKFSETIKQLVAYANVNNTKVHGLGYTRKDMLDYNFYSVDSTSWTNSNYGNIWYFNVNDEIPKKYYGKKNNKRLISDMQRNAYQHNFNVWIAFQKYMKNRGYWRE